MRITPIAVIAALILGLFGTAAPAVAQTESSTSAAVTSQLLTKKCRAAFRSGFRQKLVFDNWAHAYDYYVNRRKSEQAMFDQLRWALADPSAQDLIPGIEAMAARDRADYQPVVAAQRDQYYKEIKQFDRKFTRSGCLTGAKSTKIFNEAIRLLRRSFQDIYAAHEKLFGVNLAIQTAQVDMAMQYMTDADLEEATVSENMQSAMTQARRLY